MRGASNPRTFAVFGFVALALTLLSVVPYLSFRRTELLRRHVELVVEPARDHSARLELALATEIGELRGALLEPGPVHLQRARAAARRGLHALERLEPLARTLPRPVGAHFDRLNALAAQWYAGEGSGSAVTASADALRARALNQELLRGLLRAADSLEHDLNGLRIAQQTRILASQRRGLASAVALFMLALLALAAVAWMVWHDRLLAAQVSWAHRQARRSAREEQALRTAAAAVAAPHNTDEVVRQIASGALAATKASGAWVAEFEEERQLRVIAKAGECSVEVGCLVPYPGDSLKREPGGVPLRFRHNPFETFDGPAVVVPMTDADRATGLLVLSFRQKRARDGLGPDALARASTYADLAAVALRNARLLEDAEGRRIELECMAESQELLMRGFSHDVKNPLWAADGYLQLLEQGVRGTMSGEQNDSIRNARRSLTVAFHMLQDLLDLARAGTGRIELEPAPTHIAGLLREVTDEHRGGAEQKHIRLELNLTDDIPAISTDPSRVRQIIANLLSNAIKYTPSDGVVTVKLEAVSKAEDGGNAWLTIRVLDNGPGIRPEDQEVVFQEFVRLENNSHEPGAGIGLAISRRVADALGGRLTLDSAPGLGSTFSLWLPAVWADTDGAGAESLVEQFEQR